jgi:hypothetical protein
LRFAKAFRTSKQRSIPPRRPPPCETIRKTSWKKFIDRFDFDVAEPPIPLAVPPNFGSAFVKICPFLRGIAHWFVESKTALVYEQTTLATGSTEITNVPEIPGAINPHNVGKILKGTIWPNQWMTERY